MASSDPDVIKIHLQSSLYMNLTPMINHTINFSNHHQNREQITKKDKRVLATNFRNQKVEGLIRYSIDQQIFKFKAIVGPKNP